MSKNKENLCFILSLELSAVLSQLLIFIGLAPVIQALDSYMAYCPGKRGIAVGVHGMFLSLVSSWA